MRIVKNIAVIFCLLVYSASSAQSVVISKDINIKSDFSYDVLGWSSGEVLIFRDMVFNYDILAHDANLEATWQKELLFEKKKVNILNLQ